MTTKMTMILAGACLALAGCGGGGGGGGIAGPAELVGGPLGLVFDVPVSVLSADQRPGASVFVGNDLATVTLNGITFDGDGNVLTFNITLGLPNGSAVTFDSTDLVADFGTAAVSADVGLASAFFTTAGGDDLLVFVGFGLAGGDPVTTANAAFGGDGLFVLAAVDEDEGPDVFGFNTYLVSGVETVTLPTGTATFTGATIASMYNNDVLIGEDFLGSAIISADFDFDTVDIDLDGARISAPGTTYTLSGTGLTIVGSQYDGPIAGTGVGISVSGEAFGAFYGEGLETSTAGVFAAEGSATGDNIDIVGGYAAVQGELE